MTGPGLFLCGCDPIAKRNYFGSTDSEGNLKTDRHDAAGYVVCPEHGQRMYGWASLVTQGPQGNNITNWKAIGSDKPLKLEPSEVEDRRHEIMAQATAILSERAARRNGSSNGEHRGDSLPAEQDPRSQSDYEAFGG